MVEFQRWCDRCFNWQDHHCICVFLFFVQEVENYLNAIMNLTNRLMNGAAHQSNLDSIGNTVLKLNGKLLSTVVWYTDTYSSSSFSLQNLGKRSAYYRTYRPTILAVSRFAWQTSEKQRTLKDNSLLRTLIHLYFTNRLFPEIPRTFTEHIFVFHTYRRFIVTYVYWGNYASSCYVSKSTQLYTRFIMGEFIHQAAIMWCWLGHRVGYLTSREVKNNISHINMVHMYI